MSDFSGRFNDRRTVIVKNSPIRGKTVRLTLRKRRFFCKECKKPFELVDSKASDRLKEKLAHIPGKEKARRVALDLCDPFKNFARDFFANAELIADKFHVIRLLHSVINRHRRRLLLTSAHRLDYFQKADAKIIPSHPTRDA